MKKILLSAFGWILPVIIIIIWYYTTTYTDTPVSILPSLPKVGNTLVLIVKKGQLQRDLSISFIRVMKGYAAAATLGLIFGITMGMFKLVKGFFHTTLTIIRQIPIIAWMPLIILWFGIQDASKIAIIIIGAFFPIMVNTENGIRSTPESYLEVARLYNLNWWKTFRKVYLPHAIPGMFVGLRLGLGTSWTAVVAAEYISASSGIGYRLCEARSLLQSDVVIICMIVIGIVGLVLDKCLMLLFKALTPWEHVKGGRKNG